MMQAALYNQAGQQVGDIEINPAIFGVEPNVALMHQYVVMQQANARLGTHNTLGRGEVRGATRKIYRQKGTGRARQGSIRAPHRKGGGVAHGPHPRSYRKEMPRKMRRLAVRSALSAKYAAAAIRFVDELSFAAPKTKDFKNFLAAHNLSGRTLVVIEAKSQQTENVRRSAQNLPQVKTLLAGYLNVRDLLQYDTIIMPQAALAVIDGYLAPRAAVTAGEEA
jgi:large subunit ribosomal protein L4